MKNKILGLNLEACYLKGLLLRCLISQIDSLTADSDAEESEEFVREVVR